MKLILKILFFIIIIGCSSNDSIDSEEKTSINQVNPFRVKLGDTVTITGVNLDKISQFYFNHTHPSFSNLSVETSSFITKTNEKITIRVPNKNLFHEDIAISAGSKTGGYDLKLVGFIPIKNDIDINQLQTLSDQVAIITDGKKLYKSEDGYYTWEVMYTIENGYHITSFNFLDESNCWLGVYKEGAIPEVTIRYSSNGGTNFDTKFQIPYTPGQFIRKIKFTSLTKGFFVDNNQEMYVSDNNSFENIYDYYPNLSSLPFGKIKIWDFNAINDDLIFLNPNEGNFLIKINFPNITYSEFDIGPETPIFFGDIGYTTSNIDLYKTTDLGNSWSKIDFLNRIILDYHFLNENIGFAIHNQNPSDPNSLEVFYKTIDGGDSWKDYWSPSSFYYNSHDLTTPKHVWLFGDLWKYIEE